MQSSNSDCALQDKDASTYLRVNEKGHWKRSDGRSNQQRDYPMFNNVTRYMRRKRKEAQIRNELLAHTPRELNDIGISPHDINRIAREGARDL